MHRNVNGTGNFSNMHGKGLKPGDSALIGNKVMSRHFLN
jgi:hypothetical protein